MIACVMSASSLTRRRQRRGDPGGNRCERYRLRSAVLARLVLTALNDDHDANYRKHCSDDANYGRVHFVISLSLKAKPYGA